MRPILWKVGGAALLALVLALVLTRGDPVEVAPAHTVTGAVEQPLVLSGSPPALATRDALADATPPGSTALAIEPAPAVAADEQAARTVRGRVLDVEGRAVPDVVLGREGDAREIVADARGEFTIDPALLGNRRLVVHSPDLVVVSSGRRVEGEQRSFLVVVARTARLAGSVVHEDGSPAAGMNVTFSTALDTLASFPLVLDEGWGGNLWVTQADGSGRFAIAAVPGVRGLVAAGEHGGLRAARTVEPGDGDVELVLRSTAEPALEVSGIVIDAHGMRIEGASVHFGRAKTRSGRDGAFAFALTVMGVRPGAPIPEDVARFPLVAVHDDAGPAVIEGFGARLADPEARHDVVLRLGARALVIEGRVLHADGTPAAGWLVLLADPTVLGYTSMTLETIDEAYHGLRTDADGRFRLGGLRERTYRVQAVHRETALAIESAPVPAGTRDLVLRVPPEPWRSLEGVVRSRRGVPVPGATVQPYHLVALHPDGMVDSVSGEPAVADGEGRFSIPRAPRTNASLGISGNGIEGGTVVDIPDDEVDGVELVVPLLLRFRVELASADADELAVVDADGEEMRVNVLMANGYSIFQRFKVNEKLGTRVFEVSDMAAGIVLYRDGAELRRIPLVLVPGEVTLVRG